MLLRRIVLFFSVPFPELARNEMEAALGGGITSEKSIKKIVDCLVMNCLGLF